jgi:hypothetical protein
MQKLAAAIYCSFLAVSAAEAQSLAGEIDVAVSDQNGARVPNARIVVTKSGTASTARSLLTGLDGVARASLLDAGTYDVSVEAAGFSRLIRAGIAVNASEVVPLEVSLTAGAVSESVTVIGQTPQLEEKSSTLS